MKNGYADLHLHTNRSDGHCSPHDLILRCVELGFRAISIVDHDDLSAIDEIKDFAKIQNIELLTGVELSANFKGEDVHILGYGFDPNNQELRDYLAFLRRERLDRAELIIQRLSRMGMPVAYQSVLEKAGSGSVGRPHIAEALVEGGHVTSFQDAFNRFLGDGKPAYVARVAVDAAQALELIQNAGGICSIAHPALLPRSIRLEDLIGLGFQGIEIMHPKHNKQRRNFYQQLAARHGLIETGGSDYHGNGTDSDSLGRYNVPYEIVEQVEAMTEMVNSGGL